MGLIGELFNLLLVTPLTNLYVLLATLTGSAGVGVILLTIIIRIVTLPLFIKQMHSTRMMSILAPRMQEINRKYKDPKRRSEETMKLYREAGVNPIGCLSGMLVQMPILFALFATFRFALGEAPEAMIRMSGHLYDWDYLRSGIPLPADFLWLNLGRPDPIILPVSVAATTYVLQKMTTLPTTDERQRAQMSTMNMMMPLIFGWITITLPSGLGLYYVLSNLIGMALQYLYVGGGPFNWRALVGLSQEPVLPRSLEVRQRQQEAVGRIGRSEIEQPRDEAAQADGASPAAARRRRRYASGRRRGRR